MSKQNKELLAATIYNLSDGTQELYKAISDLTEKELEEVLNQITRRIEK